MLGSSGSRQQVALHAPSHAWHLNQAGPRQGPLKKRNLLKNQLDCEQIKSTSSVLNEAPRLGSAGRRDLRKGLNGDLHGPHEPRVRDTGGEEGSTSHPGVNEPQKVLERPSGGGDTVEM